MDYITKNKVQISYMDFRGLCVRWAFMMKGMHGKHSESSSNHEANEFHQAEIEELKSQNEKMSRELEDLKRHIY